MLAEKRGRRPKRGAQRPELIIFVKEPAAGRVKTRLGREIGMVPAAWWFRHHARGLALRMARDARWTTVLAISPDVALESGSWPSGLLRRPQGGGDLGARMARALNGARGRPRLVIGADVLDVTPDRVWAAFQALGRADVVLGPAEDGGYWLIGAKDRLPVGALEGVRWSTQHALADTVATLTAQRIARVDTLRDVDAAADLPTPAA